MELFKLTEKNLKESKYKSLLHGKRDLKEMSMINFVNVFINLIDCLLMRHSDDLKHVNKESASKDATNWNLLNALCCYAYFWAFASFLSAK